MPNRLWFTLVIPGLVACRDGHGWRAALRDYARPDTVERLHVVLKGERARGDTARRLNKELTEKNEYLLTELGDLARIVNEIDRDLAAYSRTREVRALSPSGEMSDAAGERELLENKRQRIATNLSLLTSQLRSTDSLWRSAVAEDSSSRAALESSAETLQMFRTLAENRAIQFADFEQKIDSLEIANRVLVDERDRMRDSLSRLSARVSRVYYVVGTKEELLASGVIREITVARKTWKGWQRERQLVPAREPELARLASMRTSNGSIGGTGPVDGDEADVEQQGVARAPENGAFREVDRYRDTVLMLPQPRRGRMRVVSPQELRYADGVGRDGRVNANGGRLHITDPDGFWEGGRYLVVMLER
jgi:hypothetical protein